MSNSFTTTIYNELTSDLNLPSYKNNKNMSSIFLKQGGGGNTGSNDSSDINNLLSMLTTESNLNTTDTDKIENRLKNMMQSGGGLDDMSVTSSDNYSSLFLSKNEVLSATSNSSNNETSVQMGGLDPLGSVRSLDRGNGLLSETSVQMGGNGLLSETSVQMMGGGHNNPLSTTSVSITSMSLTSEM
jgi:hypothetical protein